MAASIHSRWVPGSALRTLYETDPPQTYEHDLEKFGRAQRPMGQHRRVSTDEPQRVKIIPLEQMLAAIEDEGMREYVLALVEDAEEPLRELRELRTDLEDPARSPELEPLVAAYQTMAAAAVTPWTALSWCIAPDEALDGLSPVKWVRAGRDPARLATIARQDAARLAR